MKPENIAGVFALVILSAGFGAGYGTAKYFEPKCPETVAYTSTTETVRDTLSKPVPKAQYEAAVRVDTARLKIKPAKALKNSGVSENTAKGVSLKADPPQADAEVLIPITRKVYQTPDYRAVVSGFRPSLDSMQVYHDTRITTNTITQQLPAKKKWLALTAGPQVGVDINGRVVPSVGVGLGIILISK